MAARKKSINFEDSLNELESLIQSLEQGDLTLEQSLTAFEKGVKLTAECQQQLNDAELKVKTLSEPPATSSAEDSEL